MKTLTVLLLGLLAAIVLMASTAQARRYCMGSVRDIDLFLQYNCESSVVLHNRSVRSLRKRASKFQSKRTLCRPMTMQDYVRFHVECCERESGCDDQEVTSYCCLQ